jgi:purine nucleosidase
MTASTAAIGLILDVDTGVDDALALLYAVASPEVELIAATCVMGNAGIDDVVENTLAVLEAAGRGDVEVARGASAPLDGRYASAPEVHGGRGLGEADPPPAVRRPSERDASRFIVDAARARPDEVLLVATGPLTNVATALEEEPDLPRLLRGFAIMGGAFDHVGNVTPSAEANIWWDPEAASAVFRGFSGAPEEKLPICAGLDVTERVRMTRADVEEVTAPAPRSPVGRLIREAVPFYIGFYERWGETRGAAMHDPLAVAIAIDHSLATLVTTRVEVETAASWTRGETVADLRNLRLSPWAGGWEPDDNARVALGIDEPGFLDRFFGRLRALVESQA